MIVFPYYFGLGEREFPSDAAIANAEAAEFEHRMAGERDPAPRPCSDCGVSVPMCWDEGYAKPVEGRIEGEVVTCLPCVRKASV